MTPEEQVREVADIERYQAWPNYPWLPVKTNRDNRLTCGMVHASALSKVYLVNLFSAHQVTDWTKVPIEEFDTVAEMVAAGWVGD